MANKLRDEIHKGMIFLISGHIPASRAYQLVLDQLRIEKKNNA